MAIVFTLTFILSRQGRGGKGTLPSRERRKGDSPVKGEEERGFSRRGRGKSSLPHAGESHPFVLSPLCGRELE